MKTNSDVRQVGFTPLEIHSSSVKKGSRTITPTSFTTSSLTGFTLIELLTAISIFSILLLIIVGIFTRFVFIQRRDIGEQKLQEDLRFALELINREVRTGYGTTFEDTRQALYFRNQSGRCVKYRFEKIVAAGTERTELQRAESSSVPLGERCVQGDEHYPTSSYQALVSQDIYIDRATFTARAARQDLGKLINQGFVTLRLRAHAAQKPEQVLTVQNTVTSRQVRPYGAPR